MPGPDRGRALGTERPVYGPRKALKPAVTPPPQPEQPDAYLLETGTGFIGLEWHSDTMLLEYDG